MKVVELLQTLGRWQDSFAWRTVCATLYEAREKQPVREFALRNAWRAKLAADLHGMLLDDYRQTGDLAR